MPQGRSPHTVEFFRTLKELSGLERTAEFAEACGKQPQNVTAYLSGAKASGNAALRSSARHLFEWTLEPVLELAPIPKPLSELPTAGGIYALYDSAGNALYVGQATNLRAEVAQTLNRSTNMIVRRGPDLSRKASPRYSDLATLMSAYVVPSPRFRHNLEALLLRVFPNQSHNNKLGEFQ